MRRRRPLSRSELIDRLPRALRPKLSSDQVRDLGLAHMVNLDAIAKGQATEDTLWQWVGGLLTWQKAALLLELGMPEIEPQLHLATAVINRYAKTNKIAFTGPEYQLAKTGVLVMDALAESVDRATAIAAADWSERRVQQLADACAYDFRNRSELPIEHITIHHAPLPKGTP